MAHPPHIPLVRYEPGLPPEESARRFFETMDLRRSVRSFSDRPVPREAIEWIVRCANTAPSGAHKAPWRFVAVADPELKRQIRLAAEDEEREFYSRRAGQEWLADLEPFETNPEKPFLESAPWLIAVFKMMKTDDGGQVYYVNESVGIAVGMLLTAVHLSGLVALTHTPSPMKFLARILGRPNHERPFLLIPVGYPADDCRVPDLQRKPLVDALVICG